MCVFYYCLGIVLFFCLFVCFDILQQGDAFNPPNLERAPSGKPGFGRRANKRRREGVMQPRQTLTYSKPPLSVGGIADLPQSPLMRNTNNKNFNLEKPEAKMRENLRKNLLFTGVDQEYREKMIDEVIEMMVAAEIKKDERLITQGDVGDAFYYIESGHFNITVKAMDDDDIDLDGTEEKGRNSGNKLTHMSVKSLNKIKSMPKAFKPKTKPHQRSQSRNSLKKTPTRLQSAMSMDSAAAKTASPKGMAIVSDNSSVDEKSEDSLNNATNSNNNDNNETSNDTNNTSNTNNTNNTNNTSNNTTNANNINDINNRPMNLANYASTGNVIMTSASAHTSVSNPSGGANHNKRKPLLKMRSTGYESDNDTGLRNRREIIVAEAGPTDTVGEYALLYNQLRTATLTATMDSKVWGITAEQFQDIRQQIQDWNVMRFNERQQFLATIPLFS